MKTLAVVKPKAINKSPSQLRSIEICAGYISSPTDTNEAQVQGEMLHDLLEHPEKKRLQLNPEQASWLRMIEEYTASIIDYAKCTHKNYLKEVTLDLSIFEVENLNSGTADLMWHDETKNELHIFDYKFGFIEVDDAEVNIQLQTYGVAAARTKFPQTKGVHLHILQPTLDQLSHHYLPAEQFNNVILRVQHIGDQADALVTAEANYNPHPSACRYCGRKLKCKPYLMVAASYVPEKLALGDIKNGQILITKTNVHNYQRGAKLMEEAAKAIKREIVALAQEGWEVQGYALKSRSGGYAAENTAEIYKYIKELTKNKISLEAFLSACDISFSSLTELVAELTGKKKQEVKEDLSGKLMTKGLLTERTTVHYMVEDKS